jgi:hypothetical protein
LEIGDTVMQKVSDDDDETVQFETVQLIAPDTDYEDYQSTHHWCNRIREAIEQSDYQERVREKLHKVLIEIEVSIKDRNYLPSQAEIARRLRTPSGTFDGDMKKLRKLVSDDDSYDKINF